ncbi:hypothetical protein QL285_026309 [Trifolium repens]|nr:hypothetical protein QL285_026309 [Trifolium repens]
MARNGNPISSCSFFVPQSKAKNYGPHPIKFDSLVGHRMLFAVDIALKRQLFLMVITGSREFEWIQKLLNLFVMSEIFGAIDLESHVDSHGSDGTADVETMEFVKDFTVTLTPPITHGKDEIESDVPVTAVAELALKAMGEIRRLQSKVAEIKKEREEEKEAEANQDFEEEVKDSQPLVQTLWDAQVPANFKIPQLPSFDGKTDPLEHLMAVGTQTSIIGAKEHLKCKLLSSTFKDAALRWYMNLPDNSITSYADFHRKFIHQFAGSKHVQVTATNMFSIRQ